MIQDFPELRYSVDDSSDYVAGEGRPLMVPVTYVEKGVLRNFDMRGPDGEPLPILGRSEYRPLLVDMLMTEIASAIPPGSNRDSLREVLGDILDADPEQALPIAHALVGNGTIDEVAALNLDKLTNFSSQLILKLASLFVLIALVPSTYAGKRTVLKYSHHLKLQPGGLSPMRRLSGAAGLTSLEVSFALSNPNGSASHHLEVNIPSALRCSRLVMPSVQTADRNTEDVMAGGVVHAVAGYPDEPDGDAVVELSVPWAGLRATTFLVAFTTFVITFLGKVLPGAQEALLAANDGAAALLLALPAVVLALVATRRETALEAVLLGPLRLMVFACALLLFACAASVVGVLHEPWRTMLWCGAIAVSGVLAALTCAHEVRARCKNPREFVGGWWHTLRKKKGGGNGGG